MYLVIGVPILRGIAGWAQNALADSKIEMLEWKKLVETVLRLGVPAVALFYGFNFPVEIAVALPILTDYIYSYVKRIKIAMPVKTKK